jgi:hypothetical protein
MNWKNMSLQRFDSGHLSRLPKHTGNAGRKRLPVRKSAPGGTREIKTG